LIKKNYVGSHVGGVRKEGKEMGRPEKGRTGGE
jgi:hypothetical protein